MDNKLREKSLDWFFGLSEADKGLMKDKHFSSEYIAFDFQWGYHFTFGQIETMYKSEFKDAHPTPFSHCYKQFCNYR